MQYELELAISLMKSKKGKKYPNTNVILSITGIMVGVLFLVFTICIYDGYIKKLETIIFAIFPQITLQADVVKEESKEEDLNFDDLANFFSLEQEKPCKKICKNKKFTILEDKECSTGTGLMKEKAFKLDQFDFIRSKLNDIEGIIKFSPVVFEEGIFQCKYLENKNPEIMKLRILGVQTEQNGFVPEIDRTIENTNKLKLLRKTDKHRVIVSTELYQYMFGKKATFHDSNMCIEMIYKTGEDEDIKEKVLTLEIIDVFKLGVHKITDNLMITSLSTAQELFDTKEYASFLGINLTKPYDAKIIADKIKKILTDDDVLVFNWLDVAADMFNNLNFYRKIIITILSMSILITSFIIYNTLTIMILERKRQIGILMSMGIKKGAIYKIFFIISQIEALAGAIIGTLIGLIAGYVFGNLLNQKLHDFLPIQDAGITIHLLTIGFIFLFVSFVCLGTAFFSARKAVKLDPVQCLQSE